ncbi:MAG: threonylcarbamoyl-AMP synthase [Bacilli bacterium]|jgi:L-threonylcarbamoyladenylate synthase|nr:threonylcarbamoyl-AMP synthase [Bacilli bacterium]
MEKLTEEDVERAANVLRKGEILAFPTETVYGVGVVYDDERSFKDLVNLKKRPPNKPFQLMCSSLEQAMGYVAAGPRAHAVMRRFLPGEITVLVNSKKGLPWHVTLGTGVVGIRVPDSVFVRKMIGAVGKPCLVTSANKSGMPTSTRYEEVLSIFDGEVGGIVKGECVSNKASTIVDLTSEDEIKLIREGPVPFAELEKVWRDDK